MCMRGEGCNWVLRLTRYFSGWAHLPFSFLEQNTVFLLVTAMLKNFYLFLIDKLSQQIEPIMKSSRLKKFILHFINVPAKRIKIGRRYVLNLYTPQKYYIKILKNSFKLFAEFYLPHSLWVRELVSNNQPICGS